MNSNLEGAVTAEGGAWLEEVGCWGCVFEEYVWVLALV